MTRLLIAAAVALSLWNARPASAGPAPTCCVCTCGSLSQCTQQDSADCEPVCFGANITCQVSPVPGQCAAISACTGVGSAAAPAMGPNVMAVLAALLGAAGIIRVRRTRRRKRKS